MKHNRGMALGAKPTLKRISAVSSALETPYTEITTLRGGVSEQLENPFSGTSNYISIDKNKDVRSGTSFRHEQHPLTTLTYYCWKLIEGVKALLHRVPGLL